MRPDSKDTARLWDMLDSARSVIEFTRGESLEKFVGNRMLRRAVERDLEIIGEASHRVTPETRDQYLEIPWKSMIGLRNVLAHEYGEIRYEILWTIVQEKFVPLIERLERTGVDIPPPSGQLP